MKYHVSMAVDGRIDLEVEADNFEDAKKRAIDKFLDADLSQLECIASWPVNAEDECGNFHDY